ncbi:cation-dependent mannose-6-phosphate receptor-like [Plodia interpunctella]|uniref:cation-dependent mannose-6-phosphate receptor-like n=1 Tax=Plodia interpunctella TaxID=58824 RepID=UPI00236761B7|nr:cation-dependent mannose-6-phosphate receptor-like [Plodia interpunctella]
MIEFRSLFWCSFFYLSLIISSNVAEDVSCVQKSSCVCVFPNGTGIDLTPTVTTSFYKVVFNKLEMKDTQTKLYTYYYHPCYDVKPTFNATDTCNKPLTLARQTSTFTFVSKNMYNLSAPFCEYYGSSNKSSFSKDGLSLVYDNNPSDNVVMLMCSEKGKDNLAVYSTEEPDNIVLAFYSRHACLKTLEEPGRSLGSTLLIVFFCLVIFYLVLGICTKKFLMGATGIEVIPNLAFWSDLPNLVKDGWAFAINGFKLPARSNQMSSPDPNSYDSI